MSLRKLIATARALRELGFDEVYIMEGVTKEKHEEPVKEEKEDKAELLRKLYKQMEEERKCILYEGASGYVFGEGDPNSPVVFIGEAPGEEEDKLKRPFVGRAGQYLNSKLEQVGLKREKVYITNVVKSRPPGNRTPTREEMITCLPYLRKEIEIIKPKLLVCLGSTAMKGILGKDYPITKYRGQIFPYPYNPSIKVFLTYHPAYVLRNPSADKEFTEDLKKVVQLISQA
ncbi:MAG: uracil-DNA glycosylase [Thermocrinis sp.]|nr:uracil-DNA glycosylase [Thermocrinis sp.]